MRSSHLRLIRWEMGCWGGRLVGSGRACESWWGRMRRVESLARDSVAVWVGEVATIVWREEGYGCEVI